MTAGGSALPDQAARDRITGAARGAGLAETLFVEAGAGSGKTRSLVERIVALVGSGVEIANIVAITFTERAAAELRTRIRAALEHRGRAEPGESRWRRALDQLDAAAIGTLHAFARRLLGEHPIEAALPPNIEVLDEVASEVEFEHRWAVFRERLLDDASLARTLPLGFAAGLRLDHLRDLARAFEDNWDLVAEPSRLPWRDEEPPLLAVDAFLQRLAAIVAEADDCRDPDDRLRAHMGAFADYLQRIRDAPDEPERLRLLSFDWPSFRVGNLGRKQAWPDVAALRDRIRQLGDDRSRLRDQVAEACLKRLALRVRDFVLDAAAERRRAGRLAFHDLLTFARALLRGPHGPEVRRALRRRYRFLLLDEFQDTDPIQVELAVLLASGEPDPRGRPWEELAVDRGRLFFVGDPKQSIYRFRRADIALFLRAREHFTGEPVRLSTNFRTTPRAIDWINHVFARLIKSQPGSQPEYRALSAAPSLATPPRGPAVAVLGHEPHADGKLSADALREREAATVAGAVSTAIVEGWSVRNGAAGTSGEGWRPVRLGDIAILIPARTSLPALERALEQHDIPYRAETSSLVYTTPAIRDLLQALRSVADPSDQLALVSTLRSRIFGCGDDDLFTYRHRYQGRWSYLAPRPDGLPVDHPVAEALAVLARWHADHVWQTPSELLDRVIRERRQFELGFADGRPRDLWRRLRFVVDHSRGWSEAEGGTLREYLAWARLQASESARVPDTVLPETDDDSVRIMTIHAAKGMEFAVTVVSGLSTRVQQRRRGVQVVWPPDGPAGIKIGSAVTTPEFEQFVPIDEQMDFDERIRMLYVACTRARDQVLVSLHRKARDLPREQAKWTNAELLADACEAAPHQRLLAPAAGPQVGAPIPSPTPDAAAVPDLQRWQLELQSALARGSRPRTLAATRVSDHVTPDATWLPETEAGLAKDARDLDLPPWLRGRYGSAIGRAVHGVLQTIDLASGEGLEAAVAAQAAAESVSGREREIRSLVWAALDAPVVRQARQHPRWRESYVAAPLGELLLEGYVDLLYRGADGLVVVDYKTAVDGDDLDARAADYRWQLASYALAVERATGERVARCVLLFLTPSGAHEREVGDLRGVIRTIEGSIPAVS